MFEDSIEYTIKKSQRAKRLRLAVYCDGAVIVTSPTSAAHSLIQKFVIEKRYWIYEKLRFFGSVDANSTHVFNKDEYMKHREEALELAINRVEYYKSIYHFSYNKINIKSQKTRWGSCSRKGNLNFNYKIVFLPEEMRDYVIVHEICHLLEFSHSKKFWQLLQNMYPNYREARMQLQKFN